MQINTTRGPIDESQLVKTTGVDETETTRVEWVEYRAIGEDEVIHRSVHVLLKEGVSVPAEQGSFS